MFQTQLIQERMVRPAHCKEQARPADLVVGMSGESGIYGITLVVICAYKSHG
jgi:hypothetical protein